MRTRVSAPGKAILMGEHTAVYHRPALVAAIDLRTTAELEASRRKERLLLDLPQIGVREEVAWSDVLSYTERCHETWERYRKSPNPRTFARLRGEDPAHLVKIALGEVALHLGGVPPGLQLRLDSEIPLGAGFGSSAAAAVAVVDGYLALRGAVLKAPELHRLTLDVERRQHGLPSGIDNATVIHGGLVWARRAPSEELLIEPLEARPAILEEIRLFHSGPPAESTGAVVAAVRARREADPERFEAILERMSEATRALRQALVASSSRGDAHRRAQESLREALLHRIRDFETGLEELGVVPEPIRRIIRRIEARGGAAKISGAGALSGNAAGALLVYHPDGAEVESWDFLGGLVKLNLRLGAPGVRRELFESPKS